MHGGTIKSPGNRILDGRGLLGRRRRRVSVRREHRIRDSAGSPRHLHGYLRIRNQEETKVNWQFILAVAVGGSIGSVARYLVGIGSGKLFGLDFPWGTLIINVTGSFLIGAFVAFFAAKWQLSQAMRIFLTVGFCGGYTTFSTFSLDAFYLAERGALIPAAGYVLASVVLSIAALVLGVQIIRLIP
jgi:fluoride exporter